MGIKWNPGWEEEIARQVERSLQPKMDALTRKYKGRPVEEVERAIQREIKSWGGSAPDRSELTKWATAISNGERVIVRAAA